MMKQLTAWWTDLSSRERRLLTIMIALVAGVLLWLGLWRPVNDGIASGWTRYGAALDANAAVRSKLAALKVATAHRRQGDADIGQTVAQSASEAGLTLDRSTAQGQGRLAITIGSARGGPLLAWLTGLETRGIQVETISMTPGTTPGVLAVQAVLREAR